MIRPLETKFGNPSTTHHVVYEGGTETMYSYDSPVARKLEDGTVLLHPTYWNYSTTTNRFRNQFLGENLADTRKKIETGDYRIESF